MMQSRREQNFANYEINEKYKSHRQYQSLWLFCRNWLIKERPVPLQLHFEDPEAVPVLIKNDSASVRHSLHKYNCLQDPDPLPAQNWNRHHQGLFLSVLNRSKAVLWKLPECNYP